GRVQVPVGGRDVEQLQVDVALELGPALVEAQPGDQDALDAPAGGERRQQTAGVRGAQLIDLHAVALQQRLLEGEGQRRPVRRVDRVGLVGQLVVGAEGDADDAAGGQRLEEGRVEGGVLGDDGGLGGVG